MKRPPVDFRSNFEAAQPPILIDSGIAILENEKIERHIMKSVPGGHNLFIPDKEIERKIENLYNKFKMMLMKKDENSKATLTSILQRINDSLKSSGTRFLTGKKVVKFIR
jgi:chloride intracellular channel protein 2